MARCPTHVLHKLILYRILHAISAADGWGVVYILFEGMTQAGDWIVKIGMSTDLIRRLCEHDRVCPNPARVPLDWIPVNFRRRQEVLLHLRTEIFCVDRPRTLCPFCQRRHAELFTLRPNDVQRVLSALKRLS
ncbi:hypothetical protein BDP27DRAFT_1427104 [Rhodocollybia butyracea]|uniref:GIY-YIG nuclease family protein n=1 Tax=Rhodocollybia butyracea TaxID=206335 RepID=A0A9P5PJM6_9AGAR|nr:hypothetical protein BDP27DRAFT_1427104 [Rhodocollybia butyracea]